MKAIRIHQYGGPETMRLEEVPEPSPGSGQMLVRVHAAGVNPVDWKIREGYLGRTRALPFILGGDFAGVVESSTTDVAGYQLGDAVFGNASGSYAEYVVAAPEQIVRKPDNISMRALEISQAGHAKGKIVLQVLKEPC